MANSQLQETIPKGVKSSFELKTATFREIGSNNTVLRTALTLASLPAGRPATTFGDVPTKKGMLQMTSASRLSPRVPLALQYLSRNYFRTENVVPV
eukprot:497688-Pyramimonas_sp.AAC.1